MCGIVGYVGNKEAAPVVIEGLKRLEYRGYDSAGVSVVSDLGLRTLKRQGRVLELEGALSSGSMIGSLGIAHTRWATHGAPTEINAHPHLDCSGEISVVHNGIVENHRALRKLLVSEGHNFVSETDSEVISHLIEKFFMEREDLEYAVHSAIKLLEGTYGLGVISSRDHRLIAARRGSPLLVGIGDGERFIASDASPIRKWTDRVKYLDDGEMAVLTANSDRYVDISGNHVSKNIERILWNVDQIERGGYKFFMEKEIMEQPEALVNTMRGHITEENGIKLTVNIEPEDIARIARIMLVACGTSMYASHVGKYYMERFTGIRTEVDAAGEFRYREGVLDKDDLVVAVSQSGETMDTLEAVKKAKVSEAKTLGIVNVVGSSIAREVESGIYTHAGPEIGVASTKAFSCQIINLLLLSLYIRQLQGKELDVELLDEMRELPRKVEEVLTLSGEIRDIAGEWADVRDAYFLGRGINWPVAMEGALKLTEIAYVHGEGKSAAEMKHGPIAMIDGVMPTVFILGINGLYEKTISNMEEVYARGGRILAVYSEEDGRLDHLAEWKIRVPKVRDELSPVVNVIPLQLLAYHMADLRGLNVDMPRNLAKSVTVE